MESGGIRAPAPRPEPAGLSLHNSRGASEKRMVRILGIHARISSYVPVSVRERMLNRQEV